MLEEDLYILGWSMRNRIVYKLFAGLWFIFLFLKLFTIIYLNIFYGNGTDVFQSAYKIQNFKASLLSLRADKDEKDIF